MPDSSQEGMRRVISQSAGAAKSRGMVVDYKRNLVGSNLWALGQTQAKENINGIKTDKTGEDRLMSKIQAFARGYLRESCLCC